jgi:hypothetical protein
MAASSNQPAFEFTRRCDALRAVDDLRGALVTVLVALGLRARSTQLTSQTLGEFAERVRGLTKKFILLAQRREALTIHIRFHSR